MPAGHVAVVVAAWLAVDMAHVETFVVARCAVDYAAHARAVDVETAVAALEAALTEGRRLAAAEQVVRPSADARVDTSAALEAAFVQASHVPALVVQACGLMALGLVVAP